MLSGKHRRIEMAIKFAVDSCHDDHRALRDILSHISEEGGRVVSVMWQPERGESHAIKYSGYTIVSEYEVTSSARLAQAI